MSKSEISPETQAGLDFFGIKSHDLDEPKACELVQENLYELIDRSDYHDYLWERRHQIYPPDTILTKLFWRLQSQGILKSNISKVRELKLLQQARAENIHESDLIDYIQDTEPNMLRSKSSSQRIQSEDKKNKEFTASLLNEQIKPKKPMSQSLPKYICPNCGSTTDKPRNETKGTLALELLLWLFFILPGLAYTIWRCTTKYKACPTCKSDSIIPTSTPRGTQLLKENIYKS